MTTPVLLFECTVLDTVNNVSKVIRRASEAYNHSSAPDYYADGLAADKQSVTSLRRSVWTSESEFGAGKLDASSVDIANTAELDWLVSNKAAYGYTARYLLLANRQASYSSAIALATGVVDGANYLWDRISFRWRDPVAFLLDKTAQRRQWTGTNVLPAGVDGVDDIKDQWVPEWFGTNYNVQATCVNTSVWVFQAANTVFTPTTVYDKGSKMGGGTVQRASLAALLSNTPASGGWDWYAGTFTAADGTTQTGTFIRVAAKPDGELTVDGSEGATTADRTVAQLAKRMLATWGITLSSADVTVADVLQSGEAGVVTGTSEENRRDFVNRLLGTAGFVLWVSPAGVWRLGRPGIPSGTSVATFRVMGLGRPAQSTTEGDITEFEWLSDGGGEDQPAYQCTINHTHNGLVGDKNALAGVSWPATSTTRGLQWLGQEWRKATATDNTILTQAPLARQTKEDAYFIDATVAATEATRRLTMRKRHGPRRARLHVTFPPAVAAVVDLMSTVTVVLPRWGLSSGAQAIVYDMDVNWRLGDADIYVYF
ncbi:hypothetical protein E6C67_08465 [Azospirillum sp. TSA2s]|uniref:hypothetical protein n=1 Tax=Azospirillum sp. TSA2s TaxID=709810 RepID=UPI0010AB02D8|nr:hypothetical protein [Azospirillum sp. TSA2s]QCG93971.1 hypothetical protein E6C67_08465 [Azospirillum sp. TSA2s]